MDARINKPVSKPVMYDPMIIPRVKQVRNFVTTGQMKRNRKSQIVLCELINSVRIANGCLECIAVNTLLFVRGSDSSSFNV